MAGIQKQGWKISVAVACFPCDMLNFLPGAQVICSCSVGSFQNSLPCLESQVHYQKQYSNTLAESLPCVSSVPKLFPGVTSTSVCQNFLNKIPLTDSVSSGNLFSHSVDSKSPKSSKIQFLARHLFLANRQLRLAVSFSLSSVHIKGRGLGEEGRDGVMSLLLL